MINWKVSKKRLFGSWCVEHTETKELCIVGEKGEIWEYSPGVPAAFEILPSGEERLLRFKQEELPRIMRRLKVPNTPLQQLEIIGSRNAL